MNKNSKRRATRVCAALFAGAALVIGSATHAATLLEWDFSNATTGQISGIGASTTGDGVVSAAFDTGNNGVESFGPNKLSVTRFFSDFGNRFPFLTFTLGSAKDVHTFSFVHRHNHNASCCPTSPDYHFDVQIDSGSGWTDLAVDQVASNATFGDTTTIAGPGLLAAGTHSIRWIGNNFQGGAADSRSDYFSVDDVRLQVASAPAPLALLGIGLLGVALRRRA